ncbi:keratinocyte-associated protein 3 isoform X1 [Apteryx mantelli]|uniref:Keratinocyte-associated protein 3 isoform X1 n=1 Tax=Apteryx mantelli TaxID=2696672 RepID=A0ABM4EE83_9AVES
MAGGRGRRWRPSGPAAVEPRQLMRAGLALIVLGHGNLVLGAIVHGSVLRHVAGAGRAVTPEYAAANVVSVVSGLLSIAAGIVAILVSNNLSRAALHWTLLSVSLLNSLLSTACSVGLALAIALTIRSRGMRLVMGCNSSALPADARAAIVTNDCPFNTTRIYDTALALWFPSMVLAAAEAVLSGRCCLVALILQGIGPCTRTSIREQRPRPGTMKEGPPRETRQLLVELADSCV